MFDQYPQEFGPYILLEKIGQGGMAEIFRAESKGPQGFAKEVAIKRILSSLASNEDFITQFLDEARIVGNLSHPNIVQIYDVGQVDDAYYIAMEYIHGKHLGQVIQKSVETMSQFPLRESIAAINEISKALAFAHNAVDSLNNPLHIIHRDVSPQNVLVGYNGAVKLTDFGIAKATNKLFQTTAGVIKGKFSYLAPEQLVGKGASTASDIFSLGVAFWEMLSGRRLFQGESDIRTIQLVQACQVPPLSQFRSDVPPALEQVIAYMLSPSPEYRYQNAYDLVSALSNILMQYGVSEHLNLIANFMGSLYPEAFQQDGGVIPTQASVQAIADDPALYGYGQGIKQPAPPDDFVDAPTAMIENVLPQPNSANVPAPPSSLQTLDAPTIPLDEHKVQEFLSSPQPPAPIHVPSAVGDGMHRTDHPTNPLPTPESYEQVQPIPPPLKSKAKRKPKGSRWKTFLFLFIFFAALAGGAGWFYMYQQNNQAPVILTPQDTRATIQVHIKPSDAHVTLNGRPMEGTEKRIQKGLVSGLKYTIKAVLEGYTPVKHVVELKDGEVHKLTLTLKPKEEDKKQ